MGCGGDTLSRKEEGVALGEGAGEVKEFKPAAEEAAAAPAPRVRRGVTLAHLRRKLITKEDPVFLHKTLGILSLLNYVYRYLIVWPVTGALGFAEPSAANWAAMLVHAGLSCSGMIFRVPAKRIRKLPTTIWEEYRQHAALFSLRCLAMFALAQLLPGASALVRVAACMSWHAMADVVTARWGTPGETSVRGADRTQRTDVWLLRRVYAAYQVMAVASQLIPHTPFSADLAFNTYIAIQSSAFLMTLRRKSIVRWETHAIGYTLCLILSAGYIFQAVPHTLPFVAAVAVAFIARTKAHLNKYLIWTVFAIGAAAYTGQPILPQLDDIPSQLMA